jgi:hypothetical protein
MIQNDKIETVKNQTFYQHNIENGSLDIAFGIILIFFSLSLSAFNGSFNFWIVFCYMTPGIVWSLKKKYVYPRLGYAAFKTRPNFNAKLLLIGMSFLSFITILGIFSFFGYNANDLNFSYIYPLTILGFSLMLVGGLKQSNKYYIYAVLVFMPIAFPALFNNKQSYFSILTILALSFTIYLIENTFRNSAPKVVEVKQRHIAFIHYYIIFMAVILMLYTILSAFHVSFTKTISHFFDKHNLMLIGNLAATFVIFMGLAFKTVRFVIYALFMSLIICLPYFLPSIKIQLVTFEIGLGVIIMGIGIFLLIQFIHKYPILEVTNETE